MPEMAREALPLARDAAVVAGIMHVKSGDQKRLSGFEARRVKTCGGSIFHDRSPLRLAMSVATGGSRRGIFIFIVTPHPIHDGGFVAALGREIEEIIGAD